MREQCDRFGVTFLAWCLMSNHVHLMAVPEREESLAPGIGEAHRRHARARVSIPEKVSRTGSRRCGTVELNPVAAGIVKRPEDHEWSSARFHLDGRRKDALAEDRALPGLVDDWREFVTALETKTGRRLRPMKRGRRKGHRRKIEYHVPGIGALHAAPLTPQGPPRASPFPYPASR